ncbi:helix-turn-helix transcriptional regulator [Variovorax sp. LjRoot84]|uniref:AraC family transcriptional regulator n=1 Tax=Variovorax sp. LjRoot84 TaxID=3342340 RepID=UPI003ED0905B
MTSKAKSTQQADGWSSLAVPEIDTLPAPVFLRSESLSPRQIFPEHTHRWNQFVYAKAGSLIVTVESSRYVITPEQAIWVPTGVSHTVGTFYGAEFRNLYVADLSPLDMPKACTVLRVSPLLRALVVEMEEIERGHEKTAYIEKINDLIVEQLHRLQVQDFHLPWPRSTILRKICESLYANPGDSRGMEEWGSELGASARTLARRFEKEVGITLRDWRHRLRLFRALEWLGAGRSVTTVALELGYASTSAFTFMFRQEMGCSPTEWVAR